MHITIHTPRSETPIEPRLLRRSKPGIEPGFSGFWYLGTPFRHYPGGPHRAFRAAVATAAWLIRQRINVFAPIVHSYPIQSLDHDDTYSELDRHALWMAIDLPFMRAAHGLLVAELPGWETSTGLGDERAFFHYFKRPIYHLRYPAGHFQ